MNRISNSAERLKELMILYGLGQIDLVRDTGISKSLMSRYVSGQREPRQSNVMAICSAYNIEPAWLMGYDVPMRQTPDPQDITYYSRENAELLVAAVHEKQTLEVIKKYRQLSLEQQTAILQLIDSMLQNH